MNNPFDIKNGVLEYFSDKEQQCVTVPDGVKQIGECAFVANETVTEVVLPQGLTQIGKSAFASCKNLRKVTLPDTLAWIDEEAFCNCTSLGDIGLPPSLTHIGESAFAYCESLTKIAIPANVKTICESAFESCSRISELTLNEGIEKIEHHAFSDCVKIASLKIPSTVTHIERGAFCACNIKELTLHDGIEFVGADAFGNCEQLRSVYIGKSVSHIGAAAFGYCSALTKIEVAKDNKDYAVKGNCLIELKNKKLLQAVPDFEIPDDGSVAVLADGSFGGMKSLKSFEVPASVEKIEGYAFSDCENLRRFTVHRRNRHYTEQNNCIIEIESGTLIAGCSPNDIPTDGSVKIIASGAFTANDDLTSLSVPKGVTELKEFAFSMFPSLRTVKLPDSLISIGNSAFMDCEKLQSVTLGNGIEKIEEWAFAGCQSLTEIEFPESLLFIGENAFHRVPLTLAKFRAPKYWFSQDSYRPADSSKPAKLKNPKKAAALISEINSTCTFRRRPK